MNVRALTAIYVVFWAAVAGLVVIFMTRAGYSLWFAAVVAYLLFIFLNGSLAYRFRARQLRREGKQPPSYLAYLFFPKGLRHTVAVPRLVRILLGVIIAVGGVLFVIGAALMLKELEFSSMLHPIRTIAAVGVLIVLGSVFAIVGFRLIIVENDEPLFGRRQS